MLWKMNWHLWKLIMSRNWLNYLKFVPIQCKWIFKTKWDSKSNINRYKVRLVVKRFTERECIDFNKTFSPVYKKDSFWTITTLVAHFDLELHQMDVKTTLLNENLDQDIYMKQPEGFKEEGREQLVRRLTRSIYGFKQTF